MKIPYEKKDLRKFFEKTENIHYFCPRIYEGKIEKMEVLNEQKRSTQRIAFAIYSQAKWAAVYLSCNGKRVKRERADDTGRPFCIGSIRTDQTNTELQFITPTKRKYHRLHRQPQAAISKIEQWIEKTDTALFEGWSQRWRKRPIFLNRIRSETHFTVSLTCYGKAGYPLPSFQG